MFIGHYNLPKTVRYFITQFNSFIFPLDFLSPASLCVCVPEYQKTKNSLLNSLLIQKNRENTPSVNDELRLKVKYR